MNIPSSKSGTQNSRQAQLKSAPPKPLPRTVFTKLENKPKNMKDNKDSKKNSDVSTKSSLNNKDPQNKRKNYPSQASSGSKDSTKLNKDNKEKENNHSTVQSNQKNSKKSSSYHDQYTNTTKCNSKKEIKLETTSTSSSSTSLASSVDSTRNKDEKHTKGDSKLPVGSAPPRDDASKTNTKPLILNGCRAKKTVNPDCTLTENVDVPNSPVLLPDNNKGPLTGGASKSKTRQIKSPSSRSETSKRYTNKLYPSVSVSSSSSENESPPSIPSKTKSSNKSGTVAGSFQTGNVESNSSNQMLTTPSDLTTNNSSSSDLNWTEACLGSRRDAVPSNEPSTPSDSFITSPTSNNKTAFKFPSSISSLSHKLGIGPLKKYTKYNVNSKKHSKRSPATSPSSPDYVEESLRNGRNPVSVETSDSHRFHSTGAVSRRNNARSNNNGDSSGAGNNSRITNSSNHASRQHSSDSRYQESRRSAPNQVNDSRATGAVSSRSRTRPENQSTPSSSRDTRNQSSHRSQTNERNNHNNNGQSAFSTSLLGATSAPTSLTQNNNSKNKQKAPLKNLEDFRNVYDKVTSSLKIGRELLLCGNYSQASKEFEAGLRLMDRILETSVAQLQLTTLDDALCKSIQDVVSSNRKTALEGYSDAQAGILHPKDIPQAFPEGAPPSYTDVLKQDLHNSFAGYGTSSSYLREESPFIPSSSSSAMSLQSRGNPPDPKDFFSRSANDDLPSRNSSFHRERSLNENVISANANRHANFQFSPYIRQPSAPEFLEEDLLLIDPIPISNAAESVASVETNTSNSDLLGQNLSLQESLLLDLLPVNSDLPLNYSKVISGNTLSPINQNPNVSLEYASCSEAFHSSDMNHMAAVNSSLNSAGSGTAVETKGTISEKVNFGDTTTEDETSVNGKISFTHTSKQEFLPIIPSEVAYKTSDVNKKPNCSSNEPKSTVIGSSSMSLSGSMNGINSSSYNLLPETIITPSTGSTITTFPVSDTTDTLLGIPNSNFSQSSSVTLKEEKTNAVAQDSRVPSSSLNSPTNLDARLLPPPIPSITHLEVPETTLSKRKIIFPPDVCLSSFKSHNDSDLQSNSPISSSSSDNIVPTVIIEQRENMGGTLNYQDEQKDFQPFSQKIISKNGLTDAPATVKSNDDEYETQLKAMKKPSLEKINTPTFEHDINVDISKKLEGASVVIPNKRNIRKYSEENIYENIETIRNYLSTDPDDKMLKNCNNYSKASSSTESKITIQLNNDPKYISEIHADNKKPLSMNETDSLEVISSVTTPSLKTLKPRNSNSEPQTWNDDSNSQLNPNHHENFNVNDGARERKIPFSRSFSSSNLSISSMRVMSPSPSYQNDRLSSCFQSSSSSIDKNNSEEEVKSSNDYVLLRDKYLYASTKSTTRVELRNSGTSHYLPMSGKIFRKSLSTEDILSKYEDLNPPLSHSPQRKSVLSEFDPLKSNNYSGTPENTFEKVQGTSDSDADPGADFVNEKALQIKLTEGKFRINFEADSSKSTNETPPCFAGDIKKEGAISEDTISVQEKRTNSRTCSVNSSGVSHSPEVTKIIGYPPLTEIFPHTELERESSSSPQDAFTKFETGLKRGIKSLSSLALTSPTKSQRQKKMSEGSCTFGQSEFYATTNTPQPLQSSNVHQAKEKRLTNKKWKQVMKISDVKLYFIKREDRLVSTYAVRPTLLVLEQDLSHSTDKVNKPNARITAELASDTIWSRDLSSRTAIVFQTVSEAFIFSEFEGAFVGITLSSKTSYSKMSKFSNFLKVNTYFEKEMLLKSSTKQQSKVLKIIDDLIGEKGGQIRKDVTRKSLRGVKFARTTISNLKDQPLSPKVYEHPNTKNVFGDMGTLQAVGRILEKSIFENNMNIF